MEYISKTNKIMKIYDSINEFIFDKDIEDEEKFEKIFVLICNLIDSICNSKKDRINDVLNMLSEYDFEKNRGK